MGSPQGQIQSWLEGESAGSKNRKSEADIANPTNKLAVRNPFLSKSFKYAQATQVMLSYQETNQLVDYVLRGKFADDDKQKIVGLELAGSGFMDKPDLYLI